jgi:hypothetical protein
VVSIWGGNNLEGGVSSHYDFLMSFVHLEEGPFGIDGWKKFVIKDVFGFADLQTEKQTSEIKHLADGECRWIHFRGRVFELNFGNKG